MEKYGKIDSKAKALDYAIRDYECEHNNLKSGYETKEKKIYTNYLSNDSWNSFLEGMCPLHQGQYKDADGGELREKKGRYGFYPPKMASFGSSSRFIYRLSKDIYGFCFEKALPTRVGHTANLDGYCTSKGKDVFVEAKCREIYASHKKTNVNDVYKKVYDYITKHYSDFRYESEFFDEEYSKYTFYYNNNPIIHFDIKQLICHFLGISANILENNANRNVCFVYLIFNPEFETNFNLSSDVEKYCESVNKTYKETIGEIEKLGDMKWLFDAVMKYQREHLKKDDVKYDVKCDFSFRLTDQNNYKESF